MFAALLSTALASPPDAPAAATEMIACDRAERLRGFGILDRMADQLEPDRPVLVFFEGSEVLWSKSTPTAAALASISGTPGVPLSVAPDGTLTAGDLGAHDVPAGLYGRIDLDQPGCWVWSRTDNSILRLWGLPDGITGIGWIDPDSAGAAMGFPAEVVKAGVDTKPWAAPRTTWKPDGYLRFNTSVPAGPFRCHTWGPGATIAIRGVDAVVWCPTDDPEAALKTEVGSGKQGADGVWESDGIVFRFVVLLPNAIAITGVRSVAVDLLANAGEPWWTDDRAAARAGVAISTAATVTHTRWDQGVLMNEIRAKSPTAIQDLLSAKLSHPLSEAGIAPEPHRGTMGAIGGLVSGPSSGSRGYGCDERAPASTPEPCARLGADLRRLQVDPARARRLSEGACAGGNDVGCYVAGALWAEGEGGPTNAATAHDLFEQGCRSYAMSCTAQGTLYDQGDGVEADADRAIALYEKGCSGGHDYGCELLGTRLYERGDLARAGKILREACLRTGGACLDFAEWALVSGRPDLAALGVRRSNPETPTHRLVAALFSLYWCDDCGVTAREAYAQLGPEGVRWNWDTYLARIDDRPLGAEHAALVRALDRGPAVVAAAMVALEGARPPVVPGTRADPRLIDERDLEVTSRTTAARPGGTTDPAVCMARVVVADGAATDVDVEGCPPAFADSVRASLSGQKWADPGDVVTFWTRVDFR